MNAVTSDRKVKGPSPLVDAAPGLHIVVVVVAVVFGASAPVMADDMAGCLAQPEPGCATGGCPGMRALVQLTTEPVDPGDPFSDVTVRPRYALAHVCGSVLDSAKLYVVDNPVDENPCALADPQPDGWPIDLTAGQFTLTWDEKQNLFAGHYAVWVVTKVPVLLDPVETAVCLARKYSPTEPGIPTLSEWGVIAMAGLLLTAGTILFGRHRVRTA